MKNLKKGFVIRDGRALIAFDKRGTDRAIIVSSNADFPCFKVGHKEKVVFGMNMISLEKYGVFNNSNTIDRGMRIAGEVSFEKDGKIIEKL